MYLAVDIGGTKTLVATISDDGVIQEKVRFATPHKYDELLAELRAAAQQFKGKEFHAGGIGVPGHIDYEHGISLSSPHVDWGHVPLRNDCAQIYGCPFIIDNDANMAALSEAMLQKDSASVLYITVSTGIGTGLVHRQRLDQALLKSEGGHMILSRPDDGQLDAWENFASGKAIFDRYGKKAADITDEAAWRDIAGGLALGIYNHAALLQPDLIIIGGSIGTYFDRYSQHLQEAFKRFTDPLVTIPPIIQAQRPEEAVIFGCYDAAKQKFGDG